MAIVRDGTCPVASTLAERHDGGCAGRPQTTGSESPPSRIDAVLGGPDA
jgi:hypothetical protein